MQFGQKYSVAKVILSNSYCSMYSPVFAVCACVVLSLFVGAPFACGGESDRNSCFEEEGAKKVVFQYCAALGIDKGRDYVGAERPARQSGAPEASLLWKVKFTNGRFFEVAAKTGDIQRVVLDPQMMDIMGRESNEILGPMPQSLPMNLIPASNLVGSDLPFGEALKIAENCSILLGWNLAGEIKCIFKSYAYFRNVALSQREGEVWAFIFRVKGSPDLPICIGVRSGDVYMAGCSKRMGAGTCGSELITEDRAVKIGKTIFKGFCKTATPEQLRPSETERWHSPDGTWSLFWLLDDICIGDKVLSRGISCRLTRTGDLITYGDFTYRAKL